MKNDIFLTLFVKFFSITKKQKDSCIHPQFCEDDNKGAGIYWLTTNDKRPITVKWQHFNKPAYIIAKYR